MLGQNARESATASAGKAEADPTGAVTLAEGGEGVAGPQQMNRPAEAIAGDAVLGEYSELVDAYFRKLTLPKPAKP